MYKKHAFRLFVSVMLWPLAAAAEPATEQSTDLREALQRLPARCEMPFAPLEDDDIERLTAFYRQHDFQPVWTSYEELDGLLIQLEDLVNDGLDPALYRPDDIRRHMQTAVAAPLHRECSDIFASHQYMRALQHLRQGRLVQEQYEPVWRSSPVLPQQKSRDQLLTIAEAGLGNVEKAFDQARPSIEQYRNLRKAYSRLRNAEPESWLPLPPGPTLRPGMTDERVPLLRRRLAADGLVSDKVAPGESADRYQHALVDAVKTFQLHHSLQDDGVVGAGTLAALNATRSDRLDQLKVNLERFRWLAQDIEARSLLVDIAGGRIIHFRDGHPQWEARTQVGRATRQTPAIKSMVNRLTLNPTWTVPPTILREDALPKIRQDIAYLEENHMQVLDYQGDPLDPLAVDWQNPGRILLRQSAGPGNPLGRVVIRFANPFAIYLHDTPTQSLFTRAPRAFSSGCVRVQSVMQLVQLLLTDAESERVGELLESGQTHEFRLAEPMPILLAYWTAEADTDGQAFYRPDIYEEDAALLAALNAKQR